MVNFTCYLYPLYALFCWKLNAIDVHDITVYQIMGCGTQKGRKEYIRGQEIDIQIFLKVKFEVIVSSEVWEARTIDAI